MTDRLITANARTVNGLAFFDALTGSSPAKRAERDRLLREQCIRAIERDDLFGWPPMLVAECREIIAERKVTERDLKFTIELQRKVA